MEKELYVIYLKGKTYRLKEDYEGYYTDILRYEGKKFPIITLNPENAIQFKSKKTCLTAVRQLLTECSNVDSITIKRFNNSL